MKFVRTIQTDAAERKSRARYLDNVGARQDELFSHLACHHVSGHDDLQPKPEVSPGQRTEPRARDRKGV